MSMEDDIIEELTHYSNPQILRVVRAARRIVLGANSGDVEYYSLYWDKGFEEIQNRGLEKQFWALLP